jgi:hypothetical protein
MFIFKIRMMCVGGDATRFPCAFFCVSCWIFGPKLAKTFFWRAFFSLSVIHCQRHSFGGPSFFFSLSATKPTTVIAGNTSISCLGKPLRDKDLHFSDSYAKFAK